MKGFKEKPDPHKVWLSRVEAKITTLEAPFKSMMANMQKRTAELHESGIVEFSAVLDEKSTVGDDARALMARIEKETGKKPEVRDLVELIEKAHVQKFETTHTNTVRLLRGMATTGSSLFKKSDEKMAKLEAMINRVVDGQTSKMQAAETRFKEVPNYDQLDGSELEFLNFTEKVNLNLSAGLDKLDAEVMLRN